jgi:hypothetical protein
MILASSSRPLCQSVPGLAPMNSVAVLAIDPTDLQTRRRTWPSTISLALRAPRMHEIRCHLPSFSAGPPITTAVALDPPNKAQRLP